MLLSANVFAGCGCGSPSKPKPTKADEVAAIVPVAAVAEVKQVVQKRAHLAFIDTVVAYAKEHKAYTPNFEQLHKCLIGTSSIIDMNVAHDGLKEFAGAVADVKKIEKEKCVKTFVDEATKRFAKVTKDNKAPSIELIMNESVDAALLQLHITRSGNNALVVGNGDPFTVTTDGTTIIGGGASSGTITIGGGTSTGTITIGGSTSTAQTVTIGGTSAGGTVAIDTNATSITVGANSSHVDIGNLGSGHYVQIKSDAYINDDGGAKITLIGTGGTSGSVTIGGSASQTINICGETSLSSDAVKTIKIATSGVTGSTGQVNLAIGGSTVSGTNLKTTVGINTTSGITLIGNTTDTMTLVGATIGLSGVTTVTGATSIIGTTGISGATTITGTTSINTTGAGNTTIGGGTSTGTVTIGGASGGAVGIDAAAGNAITLGATSNTLTVGHTGAAIGLTGTTTVTGLTNINITGAGNTVIGGGTSTGTISIGGGTGVAQTVTIGGGSGAVTLGGTTSANVTVDAAAASTIAIGATSNTLTVGHTGATIGLTGTTNINITGAGNTVIGGGTSTGTVTIGGASGGKVDIEAAAGADSIGIGSTASTAQTIHIGNASSTTYLNGTVHYDGDIEIQGNLSILDETTGKKVICLNQDGNIQIIGALSSGLTTSETAGECPVSPSDARVKENVVTIERNDALNAINQLRPVSYNFTSEFVKKARVSDRKELGLIAQEVEPVVPEVVGRASRGGIQDLRTLSYDRLVPYIISSIQALHKEIEVLKARK